MRHSDYWTRECGEDIRANNFRCVGGRVEFLLVVLCSKKLGLARDALVREAQVANLDSHQEC